MLKEEVKLTNAKVHWPILATDHLRIRIHICQEAGCCRRFNERVNRRSNVSIKYPMLTLQSNSNKK